MDREFTSIYVYILFNNNDDVNNNDNNSVSIEINIAKSTSPRIVPHPFIMNYIDCRIVDLSREVLGNLPTLNPLLSIYQIAIIRIVR